MSFFKQAQDFAASVNPESGDKTAAPAASGDGGSFGSFLSTATNALKSEGAAPPAAGDGTTAAPPAGEGNLPGGRTAPTNQELLQSGQMLFQAAQGQKVDQSQLAGAASDLLGGLAAHGNLDQGTYGKYINQAEDYLDKYGAKGQPAAGAGPGAEVPSAPAKVDSQVPADSQSAPEVPARPTDQSGGSFQ